MVSEQTLLGLKSMVSANKMRRLKYSCEEVYERMDNGLCIFCDELDTPGHHDLKHKGIQIFIGDDDLACNDVEEVHQIHQAVKNPDPFEEPVKNPDALIEPLDCSSVLQVLASVPDVLMVDRVDSHVKEVEESSQQSTNGNDKIVAQQLFDQMPQRKAEEEKQQTEALRSELNRMLAELKTMTANREATMSKFLSQASIPPRPPFPPPDPPDMCRFGLVKGFVKECEDASMSGDEASHETNSVLEKETIPSSALCQRVPVTLSQNNNVTQQEELNYDMETIVENGLVQEHESPKLTDAIMEVDCAHSQEFSSQFQVPIPSLEPSRRCHKESLVVANDLSYDHRCVTSKTIGSICDFELGQDNSLDEEEFKGFKLGKLSKNERRLSAVCLLEKKEVTKTISAWNNRVWEPGGVLIERDKWKWSGKCHELSIVVRLMQGLSSTRWSYGKVAVLSQELQQPKTYLKEIKLKELDRLIACSSVGTETWLVKCSCEYKIQKLLLCYRSLKVQEKQLFPEDNVEFPEVSIISMRKGLVCDKEKKRLRNVKAAGCICDLGQVNSLDEEEFMGFTEFSKPQLAMEFLLLNSGLFMNTRLLHDKINSVFVALALLVVSEHNKAIRTRYEKAEKVDKHKINFTVAVIDEPKDIKTACVFMEMSLNRERLIQLGAPPVFIDLLCAMNRIQVRLKMVLLLEFLWLTLFTSKMFKSNVHQNKNQTDQKLSSYWKLLLRLLHPLHSDRWGNFCLLVIKPLFKGKEESVSFNVAVTSCSSYVKVLELIKDRDSRKRKLGKNWWFKFKLNTLPSETLHLWRKRKSEKLQRASKHMICEWVQNSWDMSIFGKSRTWLLCKMRILHDLKDLRQFTRAGIKFHLKHKWRSKFGSNKLTRTWTRQKAWPRVLPKLHLGAFSFSFLRTRMFSNREYCDRISHKPYHLNSILILIKCKPAQVCVNRYFIILGSLCKEKPHLSQA